MRLLAVVLLAGLAGCSTSADLAYVPTTTVVRVSAPLIATVTVVDQRDEHDPNYIGAIRGGFGNPLKTLKAAQPAKDEVTTAFVAALQARGLYGGANVISVTLTELSANWVARREGHTAFTWTLSDPSGRVLFTDKEDVLKIEGSLVTLNEGMFASIDDLRAIAALSLSTAVDQALDKPGFRTALAQR